MDPRDLLTIALNQDISGLVSTSNVGPEYQLGYHAGMRRAIEILNRRPPDDLWKWVLGETKGPDNRV